MNNTSIWDLDRSVRTSGWKAKARTGASEALKAIYQERGDLKSLRAIEDKETERKRFDETPYTPQGNSALDITRSVLKHRGISKSVLLSKTRMPEIIRARREISYWLRMRTSLSLPQIAGYIGVKNHTAVLYLIQKHVILHKLPQPPSGNRLFTDYDPSIANPPKSIENRIMGKSK